MEHFKLDDLIPCPKPSPAFDEIWLTGRIEQMLSAFRKTDYRDPKAFVTQVAMNLALYPMEVVEYVTSPTTGIQTRLQWPPSLAEIVEACRAEKVHREKVAKYANMLPALPPPPGAKFSIEQSFEAMTAKHGRPTGPFEPGREFSYGK